MREGGVWRGRDLVLPLVGLLVLGGCSASSAPKASFTTPIAATSVVRADDSVSVSVASAADVPLTETERNRLRALIQQKIEQRKAQNAADGRPESYEVSVNVTEYDKGNAVARAMLAGLGQIHVSATVQLYEMPARRLVGEFRVEKSFAWGGIYGASTTIEDVELGFAEGVAAAVTSGSD